MSAIHAATWPAESSARTLLLPQRLGVFAFVAITCCIVSELGRLDERVILPLALGAVAVAMWHGACDPVQGESTLRPLLGRRWLPVFLLAYAALVGLTLLGWYLFPTLSLVFFLVYSAWHFGTEPEQRTPQLLTAIFPLALGAVPILAASCWHPAAVLPILQAMLLRAPGADARAAEINHVLAAAFWPAAIVALAGILLGRFGRNAKARMELLAVTALEIALFVCCEPLLAFAVFFCVWHSPEHMLTVSVPAGPGESVRGNLQHNLRAGFIPWIGSLVLLGLVFAFGRPAASAYSGELFIVLSALTVPHMALNELRRWRAS